MRGAIFVSVAFLLTSCAGVSHRDSFAVPAPPDQAQALVDDSVAELVKLYPPAISRVLIPTTGGGAYGDGLRSSMRQAGYAVIEAGKGVKPDPAATPLRYYVDQPIADSYRVTLRVPPGQ